MGFDNECILNIQSLAGEYFCPVCRLLVYPNEALQSLCTHLYCKPCLTYVASTTRACPYDGYLVTEADSKPLVESNKSLAETIGRIAVHCLYHRSGCTWQGSLSDCTSHCSGCAFGNSPVVCNRCAIQIVHRQVQEHAQSCPGVQPQAQAEGAAATSATGSAATADQTLSATQTVAVTSQAQPSQSAVTAPGKDPNQQSISSSQAQAVVQGTVPTAEQWYQQQQQYQHYYQQYPGYGQYQQQYLQYYAYQQQHVPAHASNAAGQHQPQVYTQPQPQLQTPSQPQPQPQAALDQAPVATQPQNHAQINIQQQVNPIIPQHSHIQPQTYPLAHGHSQPQPQPYTQSQLQQPHPQPVQHQQAYPQPQIQQQIQTQVQPHHPSSQSHLQAQPLEQLQPRPQPNKPLNASIQSQTQNPTIHAITGHHSYPQPSIDLPMHTGVPQQYPVQMQSQFLQQPLLIRPAQPHATIPSQQQSALLPPRGQIPNIPPAQQSLQQPYLQQPGQPVHQRPVMQPVQQTFTQKHFQQQQPMPLQLRPQGQSHLIPPQTHSCPQPLQSVASQGTQHAISPNPVGRPSMPSQGLQSQPYPPYSAGLIRPMHSGINQQSPNQNNMLKTSNQMQLPSEHSGANLKLTVPAKIDATDITGAGIEIEKAGIDVKFADCVNKVTDEDKADQASTTSKDFKNSSGLQGEENGKPMVKPIMMEGDLGSTLKHSGEVITKDRKDVLKEGPEKIKHSTVTVEDKKTVDGYQHKDPPLQALEHHEVQVGNFAKDAISGSIKGSQGVSTASGQIHGSPAQSITARGTALGVEVKSSYQHGVQDTSHSQVAGVHEYRVSQIGQVQAGGFIEPPHPMPEQGKHQPLPSHYGPPTFPQRPGGSPLGPPHPTPGLGPPQTHFGPQVPGHPLHPPGSILDPSATSFGRGPSQYGLGQQSSELLPVAPQGPYNPVHSGALQPAFESHSGMIARETPHGPEMFPNQRPNYMDARRLDPHFPGSLEHGPLPEPFGMHTNMKRRNGGLGLDSASTLGPRDDRLPLQAERFNSFPAGPDHHVSNRAEFEDDLKKFPKPFDRGSHGLRYDTGLKMELGPGIPTRFLSSYDGGLSNYVGDRPGGRHEDTFGRMEPTHGHLEFFGPDPSFGRRHMDEFGSRSPGREHSGIYSHRFGGPGSDDIHGRELRRYGESFGGPFPESRFSLLPGHLRMGEFEGPGNMGMGDRLRNDFIGKDGFSSHLHRGDHMGNLYGHLHLREPVGFGVHPHHAWMREIGGPGSLDSFGGGDRPGYPHLGEPGFRSSYSLHGFPNDGGIFTEELAFDKSKKRKQPSMGWCRICKVDCETIEALELHSQTREHQNMAMDIVITIKQNAKKKKLTSGDQSSLKDASKSRHGGSEDRGNKN